MSQTPAEQWKRFQNYCFEFPEIDLSMDISRMDFPADFPEKMEPTMQRAFKAMADLESGAIANLDENRMVGHYWLRNSGLAPDLAVRKSIDDALTQIKAFCSKVHAGEIKGSAGPFKNALIIGIGGSALGPQFVAKACGHPKTDKMRMFFLDNTDPDGMDVVHQQLEGRLGETLCIVISKSGGTKETRNGMLETKHAYVKVNLDFEKHAVAVTGDGSNLYQVATQDRWLETFPMWDWVGGRTSELSAVGLLPAALQGVDIERFLKGARQMDVVTRRTETRSNPAALLALMWHYSGNGKGSKDMVVLPYKDRLELFSRYLQQLIMESLGKELDLDGKKVNQGIAVYGNKGSTDQHAYVQQLRDGVNNFFATFLEVLNDRKTESMEVEDGITSGDYLFGFFMGTRQALHENQRESVTITIKEVSEKTVGGLIALFERTVGLYASLVNINAYHQPGVEAGKKAAGSILELQQKVVDFLRSHSGPKRVDDIAAGVGSDQLEAIYKICRHLSANSGKRISGTPGPRLAEHTFAAV